MDSYYYVYAFLDPFKPGKFVYQDLEFEFEPFYIGKGKDDRIITSKIPNKSSPFKRNKILKIRKLGAKLISIIIKKNLNFNESIKFEIECINKVGRRDLNKGPLTNLTDGGDGRVNGRNSEESTLKMIMSLKEVAKKRKELGLDKHTPEIVEHLRQINLGENNPMFGKTHSEEIKESHSKRVSGTNHPMFGKKHDNNTIIKIRENRNASIDQNKLNKISIEYNQKAILQFSLSGDYIAEFNSIKDAAISTGCSESIIGKCCRGQIKNPRKFIFKFKNPEDKILRNSFKIKIGEKFGELTLIKRNKKSVIVEKSGEILTIRMKDNPIFWEKKSI